MAYSYREQANLYRDQGKHDIAEDLYKHALDLFEKSMGPDHLNVAETLEQYAQLLRKVDRIGEAVNLESRAKSVRDKSNSQS